MHVHACQARLDRGRQGRDSRRSRRTSPSRPVEASARRASRSTTTPTRRCRTRARSATYRRAAATPLAETVPAGWDQTAATCNDGSPVTNVTLSPAENVTCTFSNRKRAQLTIVTDAVPNDPQDFAFTAGGGLSPTSFSLDDDADATLSNTRTFTNVVPGSGYSVAETVPAGWFQASATCSDGSAVTNVSLSAGEQVTCTFTNQQPRQHRDRRGREPQRSAGLRLHGRRRPQPDQLLARRRRGRHPVQHAHVHEPRARLRLFGGRVGAERLVPTSATCNDGSPVSNISVSAGETVTCTFTTASGAR